MDAEIIGFDVQSMQKQVEDEKSGELVTRTFEYAILRLRSAIPESLPVGSTVELKIKPVEKKKPEE